MYSANEDFTVPLFWEFILVDPAYIHSEQHSLFNCNYRKQSLTIFTLSLGQAKHSTFIQIALYLLNYLALARLSIVPDQVAGLIKHSYYFKPISNIIIIFVSRSFVFLTYSPVPTTSAFLFNIFRSFLHITCSVRYTGTILNWWEQAYPLSC